MIEIGRSLEAWNEVLCGFTEINFMTLYTELLNVLNTLIYEILYF